MIPTAETTRRKILAASGVALATTVAGCGSPGEEGEEDGGGEEGEEDGGGEEGEEDGGGEEGEEGEEGGEGGD